MQRSTTRRALARFALVAAASCAAAALWAGTRPEQGLLFDGQTWNEEVVHTTTGPWPADGWYRIVPSEQGTQVRSVRPSDAEAAPGHALFFRLKGTTLKTGVRANERGREIVQRPPLGRDHALSLAGRFALDVHESGASVVYDISYGGRTYSYALAPAGTTTSIRAVADLDGDGQPDFLVDAEGLSTYLLLSSKAQPGWNLPTAEMPADL